ncbi:MULTISPECIES: GAP family protein [unclassified Cryobacterium]|uniref:GAP family protein n=1 Tax=unclassified Cryobacterium TaxID=2649013 RepID=UPI0018CB6923|nr:GAP family protein [Cryobacterium sp. CAN_C3]
MTAIAHAEQGNGGTYVDLAVLLGLVALALVDSTSFGTLVMPLVLLVQPRGRAGRIGLYLATIGVFYLLLGLALLGGATWARTALSGAGDALSSTPASVVQAVVGVGLFALSFRYDAKPIAHRRTTRGGRATQLERWREAALGEHATAGALITSTLGTEMVEAASMLPDLAAIGIITTANVSFTSRAAILTGYVLVMLAPDLVLLVAGRRLEPPLTRMRVWVARRTAGHWAGSSGSSGSCWYWMPSECWGNAASSAVEPSNWG